MIVFYHQTHNIRKKEDETKSLEVVAKRVIYVCHSVAFDALRN